eukprot:6089298-Pyramimonas_sp.AAC.1
MHSSDGAWRPGAWSKASGQTEELSVWWQAVAIAVYGACMSYATGCFGKSLPALRLAILTYSLWSFVEWGYHNWVMHALPKSWGRRFLRHHNMLHLDHHKETNRDMTLKMSREPLASLLEGEINSPRFRSGRESG